MKWTWREPLGAMTTVEAEEVDDVEEVELSAGPVEVVDDWATWVEVLSSDDVEEPKGERDVMEDCGAP